MTLSGLRPEKMSWARGAPSGHPFMCFLFFRYRFFRKKHIKEDAGLLKADIFFCRSSDHSLHINIVRFDQRTAIFVKHGRSDCHVRQPKDDFCRSAKSSCISRKDDVLFRKANKCSLFRARRYSIVIGIRVDRYG